MCDHDATGAAPERKKPVFASILPSRAGSRRRRIWELARDAHCPVIGVCLPLDGLRQLMNKALGGQSQADDYELHVGAVSACITRNRISEVVQAELERRFAMVVKRFRCARDVAELAALWQQAVAHGDVAGPFWAALTHPRCDGAMEDTLCREMHMIQHQAGASTRVDRRRFDELVQEHGVLTRELGKVQERCTRAMADRNGEVERLSAELMQARGSLIGKDTTIAILRADLEQLQAAVPELQSRVRMKTRLSAMLDRQRTQLAHIAELRRELAQAKEEIEALRAAPGQCATHDAAQADSSTPVQLRDKTVLCVGGRTGNVADYRGVVERVGGRFAHHDGGMEDSVNLLDANLAAADLVICQTGCISHNAYWRVKDVCKRTGKRCVFVENPSPSALARSLEQALIGPLDLEV